MRQIQDIRFALPSLIFSLLMGLTTTVHHLHAGLFLHPDGAALHVVLIEIIFMPATYLSLSIYVRHRKLLALWIYFGIAALGFVFLGLYEGGWNHTVKLLAFLRIDSADTNLTTLFPADNFHLWFYEITGTLTLLVALTATYYTFRLFRELNQRNTSSP